VLESFRRLVRRKLRNLLIQFPLLLGNALKGLLLRVALSITGELGRLHLSFLSCLGEFALFFGELLRGLARRRRIGFCRRVLRGQTMGQLTQCISSLALSLGLVLRFGVFLCLSERLRRLLLLCLGLLTGAELLGFVGNLTLTPLSVRIL